MSIIELIRANMAGVVDANNDMSLSEYLTSTGFNMEKFDVPLQVWIDLDLKQNDEWFIIP